MTPTAHQTAAEYHLDAGERGLQDLGKVGRHFDAGERGLDELNQLGLDVGERMVEVLAALTHAVLSVASVLIDQETQR
jgi:hypothetical protein